MDLKNELCKYLKIDNFFIYLEEETTCVATPMEVNREAVIIYCTGDLPNNTFLQIEFNDGEIIKIAVSIKKNNDKDYHYCCYFESALPQSFDEKIQKLSSICKIRNKRNEVRFDVGLKNWRLFGLTNPECFFLFQEKKVKCILGNVSLHGLMLIGMRCSIRIGELAPFKCYTASGIISINGSLVKTEALVDSYFRYAFRLLEPLPIRWIELIRNYEVNRFEIKAKKE